MIPQISKVDQQGQNIVFGTESCHIICKTSSIYRNFLSGKHAQDIVSQSFKVHININLQSLKRFCLVPVISQLSKPHTADYRFGAVYRRNFLKRISIIPVSDLTKFHMILFTEFFYFRFCKTNIRSQWSRVYHRKFIKHIQRTVCAIFFDRKNPRHICKMDITFVFDQITQKIQIFLLCFFVILKFSKNAIPFIYNKNKWAFTFCINILHGLCQIFRIKQLHIRIQSCKFSDHSLFYSGKQFLHISASA